MYLLKASRMSEAYPSDRLTNSRRMPLKRHGLERVVELYIANQFLLFLCC